MILKKLIIILFLISFFLFLIFYLQQQDEIYKKVEPIQIITTNNGEKILVLEKRAIERIGIKTQMPCVMSGQYIIPYRSLLYDTNGKNWVYIEVDDMIYKRIGVEIKYIKGEDVYLQIPIHINTKLVTVGIIELYGAETGIGGK